MDLTKSVLIAKSYLKEAQIEQFISMIETFSDESGFLIDWDKDDGEQWGRLLHEKGRIAMFNAKIPLFFVHNKFYLNAVKYFENNDFNKLVILNVQSWETEGNSIDTSTISDVISWHSVISCENFSINDFWYATI